jgi:hypothetical protein
MSETFLVFAIIGGFLVVFPLFWMAVVFLVSRVGGWAGLAKLYAAEMPPRGDAFAMCTARLNMMGNYRNSLNLTVSSSGIHMQPLFIFSVGHEPLFIPWSAVSELNDRKGMFLTTARLHVKSDDAGGLTTITIYGQRVLDGLQRHCPL